MRLIDAEPIENYEGWLDGTCLVIPKELIYEVPTVEAELIRHGHWITHIGGNPFAIYGKCSECGFEQGVSKYLNYCPNCGAKMEEVEE